MVQPFFVTRKKNNNDIGQDFVSPYRFGKNILIGYVKKQISISKGEKTFILFNTELKKTFLHILQKKILRFEKEV